MYGWHYYKSMRFADSDAYGVNTDNPETAYEIIDNALKTKDEVTIAEDFREFVESEAYQFFNADEWNGSFWDAWREKLFELI